MRTSDGLPDRRRIGYFRPDKIGVELSPSQRVDVWAAVRRGIKATPTAALNPTPAPGDAGNLAVPLSIVFVGLALSVGAGVIVSRRRR